MKHQWAEQVKFVLTTKQIVFGSATNPFETHDIIAARHGIAEHEIRGGGFAATYSEPQDGKYGVLFGKSHTYGPFDRAIAKQIAPEWDVRDE